MTSQQSRIKPFEMRTTVEYLASVYGEGRRKVDSRAMKCDVQIVIDLQWIVRNMGPRACTNVSGRCRKGPIVVKQIGMPIELSRKMRTTHD